MVFNIKTSGGRAKMPVDKNKVVFTSFTKHATGQHIGFRKTSDDDGTWWARYRDNDTGKREYRALGSFSDHPQSRRYDAALAAAVEWFNHLRTGASAEVVTVGDACRAYAESITDEVKRTRTLADLQRCVLDTSLASIKLIDLRARHVADWRKHMSAQPVRVGRGKQLRERERAPASINREMVPLRAALNRAHDRGEVPSDLAWRVDLKPIPNAQRRRELLLSSKDRAALIMHASSATKPFLQALSMLPLRPGAMAALTVGDWDRKSTTLRVPKDKVKAYEGRRFKVPATVAAFFNAQCKSKLPSASIFVDEAGAAWTKDTWKKSVRAAVTAAGLPPETSAYALRHSVLTEMVNGGAPLAVISKIAGTSVQELAKTYHHLTDGASIGALDLIGKGAR